MRETAYTKLSFVALYISTVEVLPISYASFENNKDMRCHPIGSQKRFSLRLEPLQEDLSRRCGSRSRRSGAEIRLHIHHQRADVGDSEPPGRYRCLDRLQDALQHRQ